jgi:hypothetical protein
MAGLVPAIPIRDLEALPTKAICHGAKPGISARVVGAYETSDMQAFEELFELAKRLSGAAASGDAEAITLPLEALNKSANEVKRSFSGSWLGYHSRVYYEGLLPAPPGANFSQEWGLKDMHITSLGSRGDWLEYDYEEVKAHIFEIANNPDLGSARDGAGKAAVEFDHAKSEIISILDNELDDREDSFLAKLKADLENIEPLSKAEVAQRWSPKRSNYDPRHDCNGSRGKSPAAY